MSEYHKEYYKQNSDKIKQYEKIQYNKNIMINRQKALNYYYKRKSTGWNYYMENKYGKNKHDNIIINDLPKLYLTFD